MEMYSVDRAFDLLKQYKITSNKESVRRWLRSGVIKGIEPTSRKEGWKIREDDLWAFIDARTPDKTLYINTTNVAIEGDGNTSHVVNDEQLIREKMWWELVRKNIFESFIDIKKKKIQECLQHKGYSKSFGKYVWEIVSEHKRGYNTPRVPYLLEAFLFGSERVLMDQNYEDVEEKILFALIEHLRKKRVGK